MQPPFFCDITHLPVSFHSGLNFKSQIIRNKKATSFFNSLSNDKSFISHIRPFTSLLFYKHYTCYWICFIFNEQEPDLCVQTISIIKTLSVNLTTGPSDTNGIAEANWNTQAPNKKGVGGTTPGSYTATTTNVMAGGYTWDGVMTNTTFTIQ